MRPGTIIRLVTPRECPWLPHALHAGDAVWSWEHTTFGSISDDGVAITLQRGRAPFYEVPRNAVRFVTPQQEGRP